MQFLCVIHNTVCVFILIFLKLNVFLSEFHFLWREMNQAATVSSTLHKRLKLNPSGNCFLTTFAEKVFYSSGNLLCQCLTSEGFLEAYCYWLPQLTADIRTSYYLGPSCIYLDSGIGLIIRIIGQSELPQLEQAGQIGGIFQSDEALIILWTGTFNNHVNIWSRCFSPV